MTTLTETEEAHVDAAFLALARLRDSFIAQGRSLKNIDGAIVYLQLACRQKEKGTEND